MAAVPDWADADAYAALRSADAPGIAWEWLRRDPEYRTVAARLRGRPPDCRSDDIGRWSLVAVERSELTADIARPIWARSAYPLVLQVEAVPDDGIDRFEFIDWQGRSRLIQCGCGEEHLRLGRGRRWMRMDVVAGTLLAGPVLLRHRISGLSGAVVPMMTLRKLLGLAGATEITAAMFPSAPRVERRILELRVHDALASGADHQAIARVLYGEMVAGVRWRITSSAYRYRVQRLATAARGLAAGGWRALLRSA